MEQDDQRLKAAAFLGQALGLSESAAALAEDVIAVERGTAVAVFAAELESSVGPAAFLIYVYDLEATDSEGRGGREIFEADLTTLETAAARGAPGPRAMAHAEADGIAFILATTPATLRALTGEEPGEPPGETPAPPSWGAGSVETRTAAAEHLLRLLRAADGEAALWLGARAGAGGAAPEATATADGAALTPEETELALFLLDEQSIRNLLTALNQLLAIARGGLATGRGDEATNAT
jgi:hypothetical protein